MVCACCHLSALARAQHQVAVKHVEDWLTPLAKQQAAKCAASFLCGRHSLVIRCGRRLSCRPCRQTEVLERRRGSDRWLLDSGARKRSRVAV